MSVSLVFLKDLSLGSQTFLRKQCIHCKSTFWHVDEDVKHCGTKSCNNEYFRFTPPQKSKFKTLRSLVDAFENHYTSLDADTLVLRRAKTLVKYNTTAMNFCCAGISVFEKLFNKKNHELLSKIALKPIVSNQFCFRFADKENVEVTKTHCSGFFMLSLHCFESQTKRFKETWRQDEFEKFILFYLDTLKINPKNLYIHLDRWSDNQRGGSSLEVYINGVEVSNMVFSDRDVIVDQELENKFIDMGLGLQRLYTLLTGEDNLYFTNRFKDSIRSICVALNDGIYPAKVGAGYNIRKLEQYLLKKYYTDFEALKQEIITVCAELKALTKEESFSDELIDLIMKILSKELERCKASEII